MSGFTYDDKQKFRRLVEAALEGDFGVLSPRGYGHYLTNWHDDEYAYLDFQKLFPNTQRLAANYRARTGILYETISIEEPIDAVRVLNSVASILDSPKQCATGNKWWAHPNGYSTEITRRFMAAGYRLDGSFADWSVRSTDLDKVIAASVGSGELMGKIPKFLSDGDYKEAINECHDVVRSLVERRKLKPDGVGYAEFAKKMAKSAEMTSANPNLKVTAIHFEAFMSAIRDARTEVNKTVSADAFVDDEHGKHTAILCVAATSYIVGIHTAEAKLIKEMLE